MPSPSVHLLWARWRLALMIANLRVRRADLQSLLIEDLTVGRLRVRELSVTHSLTTPVANTQSSLAEEV